MRILATTLSIPNPTSAEVPSFRYPISAAPAPQQQPPPEWHSPVPYLFGGLAAMLGLIAFALLILACSYWKLSGYPESGPEDANDPESGGEGGAGDGRGPKAAATPAWENNVLVIMAGQVMPTFLATPSTSRSSFASNSGSGSGSGSVENCDGEKGEKVFVELSTVAVEAACTDGGGEVEDQARLLQNGEDGGGQVGA